MNYTVISTFFFGLLIASLCAVSELHADEAEDTQVQSSLLSLFTDADGAAEKHGRPADVSALEWLVLTRQAENDRDPEARLAELLGSLRFNKSLQAFRQSGAVELGEQLLDALPQRVELGAMPADRAQRLQVQILSVLENEPQRRQQRIREEAQRIGVGFDIRKVTS